MASAVVLFSLDVRTLAGFSLIRFSETNLFSRLQIEIRPTRLKKFPERKIEEEKGEGEGEVGGGGGGGGDVKMGKKYEAEEQVVKIGLLAQKTSFANV